MKTKRQNKSTSPALPVSKQTAGGVAGAVVGSMVAGPAGALVGAIAGTIMGNRAAHGKTLVSSGTMKTARSAAKAVKSKMPALKGAPTKSSPAKSNAAKKAVKKAVKKPAGSKPAKAKTATKRRPPTKGGKKRS